ncbi:MAG: hypothetical protein ABEL97_11330 [Salinibacter sp.]
MVARPAHFVLGVALLLSLGACGGGAPRSPAAADTTYGAAVAVAGALPAPAVAAEATRYVGRRVTVDGRVVGVAPEGCGLRLDAGDGPPLRVDAPRPGGACAWQVPTALDGIAAAAGTLRAAGDTLRLTANGVQVTPVQVSEPDS